MWLRQVESWPSQGDGRAHANATIEVFYAYTNILLFRLCSTVLFQPRGIPHDNSSFSNPLAFVLESYRVAGRRAGVVCPICFCDHLRPVVDKTAVSSCFGFESMFSFFLVLVRIHIGNTFRIYSLFRRSYNICTALQLESDCIGYFSEAVRRCRINNRLPRLGFRTPAAMWMWFVSPSRRYRILILKTMQECENNATLVC